MQIKDVERIVGITKKNIRFYEEQGLLTPQRNPENKYREYSDKDVQALLQIRVLRQLDMPLSEIHGLFDGTSTLPESLERQVHYLSQQELDLGRRKQICRAMIEQGAVLSQLDTEFYLAELEQGGVQMAEIQQKDRKKRYFPAILGAATMVILMGAVIALLVWARMEDPIPLGILLFILAIPAAVIVGVLFALRSRVEEIRKGEEDEARKY